MRHPATLRNEARRGVSVRPSALLGPVFGALALAGLAVGLSGCGEDPGTRAVTGGLLGAGAGAGVAAIAGGKPATGALVGAGVGAVGGALTTPRY